VGTEAHALLFFQKGTHLAPGISRPKQSRRRQRCGRLLAQTKTVWGTPTLPHAGQAGGHLGVRLGYGGVRPTSVAGSTPIVARLHLASPSFQGFCFGLIFEFGVSSISVAAIAFQ